MHYKEAIERMMFEKRCNMSELADGMGITRQSTWNMIRGNTRGTLRVDTLIKIAQVLGYNVVLVPKETTVRNGFIVDNEESEWGK